MSKLVNKLVKQAGGWEAFLYTTLKDFHAELISCFEDWTQADLHEELDEVKMVLEAYEKNKNIASMEQIPSAPVKSVVSDVSKVKVEAKPAIPTEEKAAIENDMVKVETKEEDAKQPVKKELPPPQAQRAGLHVDNYAGACQGELPIPAGHIIVNKQLIVVTTKGGIELGVGSRDGQVRGQGVSGHVSNSGNYRFVFTDVNLGTALIHYQIQQQEA